MVSTNLLKLYRKFISEGERASLARKIGSVFIVQSLGYGLAYIASVALARWLGQAAFGTYVFTINWMQMLAMFSGLGLALTALKFIPQYLAVGSLARLSGLIRFSTVAILLSSLIVALVASRIFAVHPPSGIAYDAFILGVWLTPVLALNIFFFHVVRGFNYVLWAFIPAQILKWVFLFASVYLLLYFTGQPPSMIGIYGTGIATFLVLGIEGLLTLHALRRHTHGTRVEYAMREWWKVARPLLIADSSTAMIRRSTVLILGLAVDAEAVALFAVAERTASFSAFILMAASNVFSPMISPLYAANEMEKLQRLVSSITRWTFLFSVLTSIPMILFADFLLGIFGAEYTDGRWVLIIFLIGQLVNTLTGPVNILLNMTDYQDLSMYIRIGASILQIVLLFALVPATGIIGATVITVLITIGMNVLLYFLVRKYLSINSFPITI